MTLNCKGQLLDLSSPKVMGIINCTPDSFYDGGKYKSDSDFLKQTEKMILEGATFIDVGGQSSRPTATLLTVEEELDRVVPVIQSINKEFPDTILSIDTFYSQVAQVAIENGASLINDISAGGLDDKMMETVAQLHVPFIMMHMKGTPQTMNSLNQYEDLVQEILFYFSQKVATARSYGISDLIVDPGFGFAKDIEQNFELLSHLDLFQILDLPLLVGLSRKSMIYKSLHTTSDEALNGTTVLNTLALTKGAKILRVHDVKEAMECIKLHGLLT